MLCGKQVSDARKNCTYIIWAIYLQIWGGMLVKHLDSVKLENNF